MSGYAKDVLNCLLAIVWRDAQVEKLPAKDISKCRDLVNSAIITVVNAVNITQQ